MGTFRTWFEEDCESEAKKTKGEEKMIPKPLEDRNDDTPSGLAIAKQLDGLRVADALNILDAARGYVMEASVTLTSHIKLVTSQTSS